MHSGAADYADRFGSGLPTDVPAEVQRPNVEVQYLVERHRVGAMAATTAAPHHAGRMPVGFTQAPTVEPQPRQSTSPAGSMPRQGRRRSYSPVRSGGGVDPTGSAMPNAQHGVVLRDGARGAKGRRKGRGGEGGGGGGVG